MTTARRKSAAPRPRKPAAAPVVKAVAKPVPAWHYWIDAGERVAWTAIEAGAGAGICELQSGHLSWRAIAYAAGIALLKVVTAKKVGSSSSAAAIPFVKGTGQ